MNSIPYPTLPQRTKSVVEQMADNWAACADDWATLAKDWDRVADNATSAIAKTEARKEAVRARWQARDCAALALRWKRKVKP